MLNPHLSVFCSWPYAWHRHKTLTYIHWFESAFICCLCLCMYCTSLCHVTVHVKNVSDVNHKIAKEHSISVHTICARGSKVQNRYYKNLKSGALSMSLYIYSWQFMWQVSLVCSWTGSSIMGRFLGKPKLESFPNAAKKGIKTFCNPQISVVSGYKCLYRLFWNRKAEEICQSPCVLRIIRHMVLNYFFTLFRKRRKLSDRLLSLYGTCHAAWKIFVWMNFDELRHD